MYQGGCAFCLVFNKHHARHPILKCHTLLHDVEGIGKESFLQWQRQLQYREDFHSSVCYFCHIPQCNDMLHQTFGMGCDNKDIVGPVGYGIFHNPDIKQDAELEFGCTWTTINHFINWLNGPPCNGHNTNLTALFLWYTTNYVGI